MHINPLEKGFKTLHTWICGLQKMAHPQNGMVVGGQAYEMAADSAFANSRHVRAIYKNPDGLCYTAID